MTQHPPSDASVPLETASWITLRRIRRTHRHLEKDLGPGRLLTQVSGPISSPVDRRCTQTSPALKSALLTLAAIVQRRRQRSDTLTTRL